MNGQLEHEVLPWATHDELARQNFVQSLKIYLAGEVSPGNKVVYEKRVKPAFERQHGRPPRDRREVRQMMTSDPYYQMWSVLQRTSQEMMWDAVSTAGREQRAQLGPGPDQARPARVRKVQECQRRLKSDPLSTVES